MAIGVATDTKLGETSPSFSVIKHINAKIRGLYGIQNIIYKVMSRKITASRIADGNKLFPPSITLESTGLSVKMPGMFRDKEKFFSYSQISSVTVDTPLVGYSTISFNAAGDWISAHGFKKNEVKEVQAAINSGSYSSNDSCSGSNSNYSSSEAPIIVEKVESNPEVEMAKIQVKLEREKIKSEEKRQQKQEWNDMVNFDFNSSDVKGIIQNINKLSTEIENLVHSDSQQSDKKEKELKVLMSKFEYGLVILKANDATNPMVEYFTNRKEEWIIYKKKQKRKTIILMLCFVLFLILMTLIAVVFGPN